MYIIIRADDVEHGICVHNEDGMQLARVTEAVTDDNPACGRCVDSANFDDAGECVCTPQCGSCDTEPPEYDDSQSGYSCVDLGAAIAGTVTEGTLIPDTGGMGQGKPYGGSADCSFGGTYRNHKRGGVFDAAVASAPSNATQIINMQTMTKKCEVALPATPDKVTYAPLNPAKVDQGNSAGESVESSKSAAGTGDLNRMIVLFVSVVFMFTMI
jgi:hypothetical protein